MKIKFKPKDLGDNPVATLWNDSIAGLPYIILVAIICALIIYLTDKYSKKIGIFGDILEWICQIILYILGMTVASLIFSMIFNAIFHF